MAQILIRGGTIIILGAIAAAVPKLDAFIGLVGAVFFSSLGEYFEFRLKFFRFFHFRTIFGFFQKGLMVPAIIETVFRYPDDFGVGNWILIKNVFLVLFAILALTTGAFVSIQEIIHIYT